MKHALSWLLLAALLPGCVSAPLMPPPLAPPPPIAGPAPGAQDPSLARSAALDGAGSMIPNAGPTFQRSVASPAGPVVVSSLTLPDTVFFDFGLATPRPDAGPALDALARAIQASPPDSVLTVAGNTDAIGTARFNQSLSDGRARAVIAALISRGIPPARLAAVGFGATRPIAANDSETGRAENRRVELALSPSFAANAASFTASVPVSIQATSAPRPPMSARRAAPLNVHANRLDPIQRNNLGPPVSY